MYLGRRAEKEQHGQGATADSASRVESLAEAFAPHEDPVSASAGASGRDPNAEPLADSVPEDTPQQVTLVSVATASPWSDEKTGCHTFAYGLCAG